jgi:diguanylate cyclase (GGDEF)-like protein
VTSVRLQTDAKPLILIADDSKVVRVSLKNILQQDYHIIEAEDGEKAWNLLLSEPGIRLVFSDLSMPKLDGLGLLSNIRHAEDEQIRTIPFIVVTGKDEDEQMRNQLLQQGANDLITKPFINHEITARAKRHIKQTQMDSDDNSQQDELLSGITNKSRFTQIVKKELSFAIRNKNELALLLLKLDQFETIKKNYSDPAIEHILITTAEIIRAHTHIDDKIAFFGDGTFAILLPASNAISTRYLGKRILSDLEAKKFYLGESDATVTASIGISAPDIKPTTTFSEILHLAEQRLQAAINAGGQRVVDKGNATITPVSTLLTDPGEDESDQQKVIKQTEKDMRQLAMQEVEKIKANRQFEHEVDSSLTNAQEINDALLLAEQENKIIKEELVRLRLKSQEMDQLKQQLHETDSLLQQTQLSYKQMRTDYETLRTRAETAESHQTESYEPNLDTTIVEQHLLQENDDLQKQLNAANQRIEESSSIIRKSEQLIANLKQQLLVQKNEFNQALAAEQKKCAMAEHKFAQLEAELANVKKEKNQLSLSPVPTVNASINTTPAPRPPTAVAAQTTRAQPAKPNTNQPRRTTSKHKGRQPKSGGLLKIVAIVAVIVLGAAGYLLL